MPLWSEYYLSSNMNFYPKEWRAPQLESTETPFFMWSIIFKQKKKKKKVFSEILQNKAMEH